MHYEWWLDELDDDTLPSIHHEPWYADEIPAPWLSRATR